MGEEPRESVDTVQFIDLESDHGPELEAILAMILVCARRRLSADCCTREIFV
jgi:hypothetical protein